MKKWEAISTIKSLFFCKTIFGIFCLFLADSQITNERAVFTTFSINFVCPYGSNPLLIKFSFTSILFNEWIWNFVQSCVHENNTGINYFFKRLKSEIQDGHDPILDFFFLFSLVTPASSAFTRSEFLTFRNFDIPKFWNYEILTSRNSYIPVFRVFHRQQNFDIPIFQNHKKWHYNSRIQFSIGKIFPNSEHP